jgi:hypothetical protein
MKLSKFILLLGFITLTCVIYVQLQVQIFELAYNGKKKEMAFKELLDRKSTLMYNIFWLESAQNIGQNLLSRDVNLQFSEKSQIAKIDLPIRLAGSFTGEPKIENKRPNFFG